MTALTLTNKDFSPINDGAATFKPTEFSDVVSSGFRMSRDNFNSNSSSRLIADIEDERSQLYRGLTNKALSGSNYSQANPILALGSTQDSGGFTPVFEAASPDLWAFAQRLHKDDSYVNLHIKELKDKDPEKYKSLLTNEEVTEEAKKRANLSRGQFETTAAKASEDARFYGAIAGTLGGAMTDPINVVTMPLGAGASGGILRAMKIEAGIQAGVETTTQPSVIAWQKELGQEYGLGDASANVMGAAFLGGALTGVIRGVRPTAQVVFAKMQDSTTFNALQKRAAGYKSREAHYKEANPDPRTVNELHAETTTAASRLTREGKNMAEADLPMTNRQFNEIDTTNTRGASVQQKSQLEEVSKYQKGAVDISDLPDELVNLVDEVADVKKLVDDALSGENNLFSIRSKEQIKQDARLDEITTKLDEIEVTSKSVRDIEKPNKLQKQELKNFSAERAALFDEQASLRASPAKGIVSSSDPKKAASQIRKIAKRVEQAKPFRASTEQVDAPSILEPDTPPLNNKEMNELLTRMDSTENTKAQEAEFSRLVEANKDELITLDDGSTIRLDKLVKELDNDQKIVDAIQTCAIG